MRSLLIAICAAAAFAIWANGARAEVAVQAHLPEVSGVGMIPSN